MTKFYINNKLPFTDERPGGLPNSPNKVVVSYKVPQYNQNALGVPSDDDKFGKDRIAYEKNIISTNFPEKFDEVKVSDPIVTDAEIAQDYNRRNVRMPLDARAIRQDKFDLYSGKFDPNYPIPSNYTLCPQKISTVFNNGKSYWTSSYNTESQEISFQLVEFNANDCVTIGCGDENYINFTVSNVYFDGSVISFNDTIRIGRYLKVRVTDSKCLDLVGDYIFDLATNSLYATNKSIFRATVVISSYPEDMIMIVLYPENNTDKYLSIQSKFIVNPSDKSLQDPWVVSTPTSLGKAEVIGCLTCSNTNGSMEGYRVEGIYLEYGENVLCYPQVTLEAEYKLPIDVSIGDNVVTFGLYKVIPGYAGFNPDEFDKNTVPSYEFEVPKVASSQTIQLLRTQIYKFDLSDPSLTGLTLDFYTDSDHTTPYTETQALGDPGTPGAYILLFTTFDPPSPTEEKLYWTLGSYSGILEFPLPVIPDTPSPNPTFEDLFPVPAPCWGGHGCNSARYDIYINDVRVAESNANNSINANSPAAQEQTANLVDGFSRQRLPPDYWETLYDPEIVNRLKTTYDQKWPKYADLRFTTINLGPVHVVNGSVTPEGIGLMDGDRLTYAYITKQANNSILENAPPPDPSHNGNIVPFNISVRTAPHQGNYLDKDTGNPLSAQDWDNRVPNGVWRGGHGGVTWVRVKDCSNRVIYSCCVGEGYGNPSCPTCPTTDPPPPEPPAPPPTYYDLYVDNKFSTGGNGLKVFNSSNGNLIADIPFNGNANQISSIAVNLQANKAYVTDYASEKVHIVDTNTYTYSSSISLPGGSYPQHSISYENYIYVCSWSSNKLYIINTSTDTIEKIVDVWSPYLGFHGLTNMAINYTKKHLYVVRRKGWSTSNELNTLDLETNDIIATVNINTNIDPTSIQYNPGGDNLYVGDTIADKMVVIDIESGNVITNISDGFIGHGLTNGNIFINSANNTAYTANQGPGDTVGKDISIIDTSSNTLFGTLSFGGYAMNLVHKKGILYVNSMDRINFIDTNNFTLLGNVAKNVADGGLNPIALGHSRIPVGSTSSLVGDSDTESTIDGIQNISKTPYPSIVK